MTEQPAISVLVCSKGRRAMLERLISDLRAQQGAPPHEIVVVEETDAPRPIDGVRYVPHPVRNRGIAHARNLALAHARHDWVVFVDDDCRVGRDWLARLAAHARNGVVAAQGGVVVPEDAGAIGWAESLLGFPGGGVARIHASGGRAQRTREVSTLNALYFKPAVEAAGGFDPRLRLGGEDWLLARRLAAMGELWFVPDACVVHAPRGGLLAIARWFVRRGRAELALWRAGLAPAGFGRWLLRASLGIKLVAAALAWPWIDGWGVALVLAAHGWASWRRVRWAWRAPAIPRAAVFVAPVVRLVMDLGADVGRLREWLFGSRI